MGTIKTRLHDLRGRSFVSVAGWLLIAALGAMLSVQRPIVSDAPVIVRDVPGAVSCLEPDTVEAFRRCSYGRY